MEVITEAPSTIVQLAAVKEEPLEAGNQEAQQSQMLLSHGDEHDQRAVCTPESQENEARTLLSKCVFCSKNFTNDDNAKLLECLHAACATCITNKLTDQNVYADMDIVLDGNVVVCQICNVASQLDNLIENRFHTKFIDDDCSNNGADDDGGGKEVEDEKKCTSCHDNATATSWCVDCEEFICQNCVMAHQRLKITKDHTIKPKDDLSMEQESLKKTEKKQPVYLFCSVHSHEQLSLFCQTCDQLTCRDCQLSEHRDHKYKFIHEIAAETRASVATLLKEVSYKRVLLKSAMKVIEDRQVLIVDKKKTLVQEITQMVVQLTNAINTRGKQLIMRLNDVCDQKQNTLNEKRIALDQLSKLTDHCIQFVTYALEKGSDMELLYSKKSVTGHLQRIKNRRADIPNPEIPVRIHISLDKVPDLIKVVSSIGSIVVDGRVYPSTSPSSGTSTPTTRSSDTPPEPKQTIAVTAVTETISPASILQQATTPITNTYPPVTLSYPQLQVSQPQMVQHPPTQLLPQSVQSQNYLPHYSTHSMPPRTSPQTQHQPRMPYTMTFNGRPQLIMSQRPGIGNCHQQVTSSTHPQQQIHLEQLGQQQNASLRGLLAHNPPPFRPVVSNQLTYRLPPGYRYPAGGVPPPRTIPPPTYQPTNAALVSGGRVQQMNPAANNQMNYTLHQQAARWHIPQAANTAFPYYPSRAPAMPLHNTATPAPVPNDAYKIMLKTQQTNNNNQKQVTGQISVNNNEPIGLPMVTLASGQTVTSSVPKTPSPVPASKSDETEKSLDKFCQKSLSDLMLTIAKLDSNGIVVIPEAQKSQLDSSQVDSSTDEALSNIGDNASDTAKSSGPSMTKDDPNEDWCAVCMDGGDAVLCCDKCPKVFHLYCHIPSLKSFPDESETWQCMLCTNVLDCSEDPPMEKRPHTMSPKDLRIAQRIVLELYCQYEQSLPFREVVSPEIVDYHRIIKKPIALDIIKEKLKPDSPNHYTDLRQVLADIRLMFKNAFTYNPVDSQVYQQARNLEEFFEKLLLKWAPHYAYDDLFLTTEGDDEEEVVFPPNKKYRRIIPV